MLVTLLTPTGTRPEALSLCKKYMQRQTYTGDIQWIMVHDAIPGENKAAEVAPMGWENMRRQPLSPEVIKRPGKGDIVIENYLGPKVWHQGINTQRPNMDEAIKHVMGDYVFIVEDDDHYSAEYIDTYLKLLQLFPVVGEGNNRYYAIKERAYREWGNFRHASLCSTALRKSELQTLDDAVNSGQVFPDIAFWNYCTARNIKNVVLCGLNLSVGMKQLPGRMGIGSGHVPKEKGFSSDPGFEVLRKWIGIEDTKEYVKLARM